MGETPAGFLLTSKVYTAKKNDPASIHQSPAENLNASSRKILPCDNKTIIPVIQKASPAILNGGICSLKKIAPNTMVNTGEVVVPISAIFIAVV